MRLNTGEGLWPQQFPTGLRCCQLWKTERWGEDSYDCAGWKVLPGSALVLCDVGESLHISEPVSSLEGGARRKIQGDHRKYLFIY